MNRKNEEYSLNKNKLYTTTQMPNITPQHSEITLNNDDMLIMDNISIIHDSDTNIGDTIIDDTIIDDSDTIIDDSDIIIDDSDIIIDDDRDNDAIIDGLNVDISNFERDFQTGLVTETTETAVIYQITNRDTGLFYIGRSISYQKCGYKKGATGRFREHINTAKKQKSQGVPLDCPSFYPVLLNTNKDAWDVKTLLITPKGDAKKFETMAIKYYRSYLPEIGYNFFIADNKPIEGINKQIYTDRKVASNRKRAVDGKMKRSESSIVLPPNVYYRPSKILIHRSGSQRTVPEGYHVQIKIAGKNYTKGFMASDLSMEKRLELANKWLADLKKEHGLD